MAGTGPQCYTNPPTLSSTCAKDTVEEIGGLRSYVTGPSYSKLAILFLSDVFGYEAPNLRKLADKVAAAGYFVVVPDFFGGDYFSFDPTFDRQTWLKNHSMDKGFEDAKTVVAALKGRGVSSIGAVGFCWGGNVVVKLANSIDYIQAGVALHPVLLTPDDINDIKVPLSILGAEFDEYFSSDQLKHFEKILSAKSEVESFVKIFPGVSHGWSVIYKEEDDAAVESAKEAHTDMLNWLNRYIK